MNKRKILTDNNCDILYNKLKEYLSGVLEEEEYINSYEKAWKHAYNVEVYGTRRYLTPDLIADWLRGLPLGTIYCTYNICCMLFDFLDLDSKEVEELGEESSVYLESQMDLDTYYWNTLGRIIYDVHYYG